jgi:hypothetical protein
MGLWNEVTAAAPEDFGLQRRVLVLLPSPQKILVGISQLFRACSPDPCFPSFSTLFFSYWKTQWWVTGLWFSLYLEGFQVKM